MTDRIHENKFRGIIQFISRLYETNETLWNRIEILYYYLFSYSYDRHYMQIKNNCQMISKPSAIISKFVFSTNYWDDECNAHLIPFNPFEFRK